MGMIGVNFNTQILVPPSMSTEAKFPPHF